MKNYLFPKFFQHMRADELASYCRSVGIDGPTLMIRDGYWVEPKNVFETLPAFVRTMQQGGCEVRYADTPYDMERLGEMDDVLSLMQDNGIALFRVNYILKARHTARDLHELLCRGMEAAEKAARKHGMKAVVQIHGHCYPHNATSAYFACKSFDPKYLGIKVDPGNNIAQEGDEEFSYQIDLLREYVAAVGEKDARMICDGDPIAASKGWRREFVPANTGFNNYMHLFAQLKKHHICVPGILMPFYHEKNPAALMQALTEEIAYFKHCQEANGL